MRRVAELNKQRDAGDVEAGRFRRSMNDTWTKRTQGAVTGFWRPNAKGPRYETA